MILKIGQNQKQPQGYSAFIPEKFPPKEGFVFDPKVVKKSTEATLLLGKLDGITQLLPDVDFFLFMYIRKDASSSSQIEGTKATIINAIEAESDTSDSFPEDVNDILKYIKALNYGIERIKNFSLSLRMIKEIHQQLMENGRKTHFADPGNFRTSQNWIGGTSPTNASFVPPPVYEMNNALSDLEQFIHTDDTLSPIIKAGIIHGQFETIHPFLDGNGRTGRLLITFYIELQKILERPVLFLSSYFKKHQKTYYQKIYSYHYGQLNEWLEFFLDGVIETAQEAIETVKKITILREQDMAKVQSLGKTASESAVKILPLLFQLPIVNVTKMQEWTGFTRQGAQKVIDRFVKLGILEQKDENKTYGRSFIYRRYTDIFEEEKIKS